jgi:hypothetical protein
LHLLPPFWSNEPGTNLVLFSLSILTKQALECSPVSASYFVGFLKNALYRSGTQCLLYRNGARY